MNGVEMIAAERERQVQSEGWTPEHDDAHVYAELIGAARAYAREAQMNMMGVSVARRRSTVPIEWPWEPSWWKPNEDPIRDLVKAGALIAAEIDRLQRVAAKEPGQ